MRIVIAEDLYLLREGLVRLLSAHGLEIAAAVASAPELLEALVEQRPDVGIVDVRLPPTHTDDGLRAALQARARVPGLPVLVLSQYVERLYARELLADQAGGVGYLLKDRVFNDEAFIAAIRTVAAGGTVLDPEVVAKLMSRRARDEPVARLTPREREVLALMAEGRSNAAIAQLFITEKAVSKHAAGIFDELELALSDDDNYAARARGAGSPTWTHDSNRYGWRPDPRGVAPATPGFMPEAEEPGPAFDGDRAAQPRAGPGDRHLLRQVATIYLGARPGPHHAARSSSPSTTVAGRRSTKPGWEYHDPGAGRPA